MIRSMCVVVLVIAIFVFPQVFAQDATEATTEEVLSEEKIFVNPNNNAINYLKPPRVKPTTHQVEFVPGIPPGHTTVRSTRFTSKEVVENGPSTTDYNNSKVASTAYPPGVSPPEPVVLEGDRNPVNWFLGLLGVGGESNSQKPLEQEQPSYPGSGPARNCNNYCKCGLTYKHNRIVGGIETQVNEYPWMVVLKYNKRFFCGGSLINNKYVITAGHCVQGFSQSSLSIELLDHDRSTTHETQTITRRIAKVIKHRSYGQGGSYNNDIALLQLEQEVPFNGIIKPVCLPTIGKSYTGFTGIVTGWGATASHGQVSNKLQEVRVPILSNEACRKTGYGGRITENMLCAGFPHGTKDSCQGDSGGPLHVSNGTYHTLVGIVSWGEGCAEPNYPGVYTRVNRYHTWILGNTKDACYCS